MKDIELPPLPKKRLIETIDGHAVFGWPQEDLQTYARAAVEADRARRAQPDPNCVNLWDGTPAPYVITR